MVTNLKLITKGITERLSSRFPAVFSANYFRKHTESLLVKNELSESELRKFFKGLNCVPIEWNKKPLLQLYSFKEEFELENILSAWTAEKFYLSHYSALYWNNLVEQRPVEHFLSAEITSHKNSADKNPPNPEVIKQVFMKAPRETSNFATFGGMKFVFVERANCGEAGVMELNVSSFKEKLKFQITDVERTLIDCAVAPHYSGGLPTVIQAFLKASLNIEQLSRHYKMQNFLYPYWQSIGFLIEICKGKEIARNWMNNFEKPKIDFYIDRNYRADWSFHKEWKIYFPKNLVPYGD